MLTITDYEQPLCCLLNLQTAFALSILTEDISTFAMQSAVIWALLRAQAKCWLHQRLLGHASDYVVNVFALDGNIIQLCLFYIGHDIGEYIGCFIWDKCSKTTEIGPEQSNTTECARWCFSKSKSFYKKKI